MKDTFTRNALEIIVILVVVVLIVILSNGATFVAPTFTVTLTVAIVFTILAFIFYLREQVGKATFWILAAILAVLMGA